MSYSTYMRKRTAMIPGDGSYRLLATEVAHQRAPVARAEGARCFGALAGARVRVFRALPHRKGGLGDRRVEEALS